VVRFKLPEVPGGEEWLILIDTNHTEPQKAAAFKPHTEYEVTGRSLLLFGLKSETLMRQTMGITEAHTAPDQPTALAVVKATT
jgi:glycogen operon protein